MVLDSQAATEVILFAKCCNKSQDKEQSLYIALTYFLASQSDQKMQCKMHSHSKVE